MDTAPAPAELAFFDAPEGHAPYQRVQYVDYRSSSVLNDGGPLQFVIPPTASQFIDLQRSRLHVKARVVLSTDEAITDDDNVAPNNNVLHSMFGHVEVQLQQQLVSVAPMYPYKAYMERILTTNKSQHTSFLESEGFERDTPGQMEATDTTKDDNEGLLARGAMFTGGRVAVFEGPVMADICQQERFILNGVEIIIKLWPSKPTFNLMTGSAGKGYKLSIVEAYLSVCKVTPTPAITMGIESTLKEKPALYPYTRTEMRAFQLPKDQYTFHLEDIYQQNVPSEVILGFVNAKSHHGDYSLNPFNFKHYDLGTLGLYIDDESVPAKPLKMNYANLDYITAYNTLFSASDREDISISRLNYDSGFALYRFRVIPEQSASTPPARGNVKLIGTFSRALPHNVTLIVIGKFNSILSIDHERVVSV